MRVLGGDLGPRIYLLPSGSIRFFAELVEDFLFEWMAICFNQDCSPRAFVVGVNVSGMFVPCLRLRLLLTRESGRVLRRSPIGGDSRLISPQCFRTNGLPCLCRESRYDDCWPFFVVRVGRSIRPISRLAVFKCVANKRRSFSLFSPVRVRARVSLLSCLGLIRFSWFGTRGLRSICYGSGWGASMEVVDHQGACYHVYLLSLTGSGFSL